MERKIFFLFLLFASLTVQAQQADAPFRGYLYNKEYDVYMRINFYEQDITIPGQEIYGQLPGFLSKTHNSFCWLIVSVEQKKQEAQLTMVNDYGSEDLTATLTCESDSVFILRQQEGSSLKVPKDRKWQKLPKIMEFRKR